LPEAASGVLITRPEPGATETAARIEALGLQPILAPLLEIRMAQPRLPPPKRIQAVLITSGSAVAGLCNAYRDVPLLTVGDATAARARAAGFAHVLSAAGDAGALASLAASACNAGGPPLLVASGQRQGHELAADLRGRGFRVVRRVVYAAIPVATLPKVARQALIAGTVRAALFFSAETARHGVRLLQRAQLHGLIERIDALAIGQPAAVALQALQWRRIRVAARPTQDAMLELLR
jgi:uroporphyrinogen-III synthase